MLRGAAERLAMLRRRKLVHDKRGLRKPTIEVDEVSEARKNFQRILVLAREIPLEEYETYLSFFYETVGPLPSISGGAHFDNLDITTDAPSVALSNEFAWIAIRLRHEQDLLLAHTEAVYSIDACLLRGQQAEALEILNKHVESAGHSLWSVKLKFALLQATGGLEAQKKFLAEIRKRHRAGMLPYIAYQTSVRNEERTTLGRFRDNLETPLKKMETSALGNYLTYVLFDEWPEGEVAVTDVFRLVQTKATADIYEVVVSFGQQILRDETLRWLLPIFSPLLASLVIRDPRLDKLRLAFGLSESHSLQPRNTTASNYLFAGDLKRAVRAAEASLRSTLDVWSLIYKAAALAHQSDQSRVRNPSVSQLLTQVMSRSAEGGAVISELQKASLNYSGSPSMRAVYDFANQLVDSHERSPFERRLVGLNSTTFGPEDVALSTTSNERSAARLSTTEAFWSGMGADAAPEMQVDASMLCAAARLEIEGDQSSAVTTIKPSTLSNNSAPLRMLSAGVLLRSLNLLGRMEEVIDLISKEAARPTYSLDLLPVTRSLRNIPFDTYKRMGAKLSPLIALDVLQKSVDDDKVRSQLRFLTKRFLQSTGKRPSVLAEDSDQYDHDELVYFLRYVCVPSVLDMAGIFSGSADVSLEREAICAVLAQIDPSHTEDYEDELFGLVHQRNILEGLQIVDKNRLHVDTDAIARNFERLHSEEYARYLDLQRAGIGVSGNYDDVVREIVQQARQGKQILFVPENEGDNAFVRLVGIVLDDFLHNASYGLDYFLSKRVRHQSFVGLIRGPLEFEQIISTKETAESEYKENDHWLAKLGALSDNERGAVSLAFRGFSDSFDKAVFDIKDRLFHVKSSEHPDGIFEVPVTTVSLLLARAVVKGTTSPAEFAAAICEILWVQIEPNLKMAREVISGHLKNQVAELIDKLKLDLAGAASHDSSFSELQVALGRASGAVQTALSEAEAWFNRPNIAQASRLFTLQDAVDIAIQSAKKLHKGFDADISAQVQGDLSLLAGDMVFLTDAVFIAFSNVRAYCGLKTPKVVVSSWVDVAAEQLHLEIVNDTNPRQRSPEQDAKLASLRAKIDAGDFDKQVRREGGTGFLKLAAVVSQSSKGALSFGYSDETHFRVSVAWSVILAKGEIGAP